MKKNLFLRDGKLRNFTKSPSVYDSNLISIGLVSGIFRGEVPRNGLCFSFLFFTDHHHRYVGI
jgi:hypothetical protein